MGGQDDVEPLSEVVGGYGSPGPYGTSVVGEYGTSVGRYGRIWELWASLWEDVGGYGRSGRYGNYVGRCGSSAPMGSLWEV